MEADGGEQLGGLELVAVRGRHHDQVDVGIGDPRDLGGESRVVRRGADGARYVRLVELLVGAGVDEDRSVGDRHLHGPG